MLQPPPHEAESSTGVSQAEEAANEEDGLEYPSCVICADVLKVSNDCQSKSDGELLPSFFKIHR